MSDQPPPPPPPPPPAGPPPGPPAGSSPEPAALESVGPWPRLGARIIDWLVLLVPTFVVALVIVGGSGSTLGAASGGSFFAGVVTSLISFGYFVWLESTRGRTVGKMALGITVVGVDGRKPSGEVSARRNAWMLLSILPGILGGLLGLVAAIAIGVTISNDPFNRGVHDNFAGGTAVVRTR